MNKSATIVFILLCVCFSSAAQQSVSYNLADLLKKDRLMLDKSNHAVLLNNETYADAISIQKIAWLKNVSFKKGTIDIDLRGKDVFLQSFLGIAFHASDNNHYELVYFRPFNFQYADTARRRWSLQYMVMPDYPFYKLRKEHPLVYENSITPAPKADEWFHASVVITTDSVKVYVNHASTPSLQVRRLINTNDGKIGLWDDELPGDFANLVIRNK